MATDIQFVTLHRYYIWANRLRTEFDRVIEGRQYSAESVPTWFADAPGMFMSHWYVALYVVVEGWRELDFHDDEIDALLASPTLDQLRRYRHGVCHFQPTYLDDRFVALMSTQGSVTWIRGLNLAFGRWFLAESARRWAARAEGAS